MLNNISTCTTFTLAHLITCCDDDICKCQISKIPSYTSPLKYAPPCKMPPGATNPPREPAFPLTLHCELGRCNIRAWFRATWNRVVSRERGTARCESARRWRLASTAATATSDADGSSDQRRISSLTTYTVSDTWP